MVRRIVWAVAALAAACVGCRATQPPSDARLAEFRSLRSAAVGAARDVSLTPTAGSASERTFEETDSDATLVGLRCAYGDYSGYRVVCSVTPVFRGHLGHDRADSPRGDGGSDVEERARPGYAVGALVVRTGDLIDGLYVVYFRDLGDRLDPDDAYTSPWMGGEGGDLTTVIAGDGRRVVGVHGVVDADGWIQAIGLVVR